MNGKAVPGRRGSGRAGTQKHSKYPQIRTDSPAAGC